MRTDPTEEKTFALGEPVTFTHVIWRDSQWVKGEGTKRTWKPTESPGQGFIVGWRTLSDGTIEQVREDNGYGGWVHVDNQWRGTRYFRGYLVTVDLRQNPIWVLPEHLTSALEQR